MQFIIKGRNLEVTEALKQHVREKLARVERHFDQIIKADVELTFEPGKPTENHVVEVTLFTKGPIVRATAASDDMYASIDGVTDKLEKQIDRYKGRAYVSSNKHAAKFTKAAVERNERRRPKIVKRKQFLVEPMSMEEAQLQMELLGHDFFVYADPDQETINIIYRRKDDNYGVIEAVLGR